MDSIADDFHNNAMYVSQVYFGAFCCRDSDMSCSVRNTFVIDKEKDGLLMTDRRIFLFGYYDNLVGIYKVGIAKLIEVYYIR